MFFISAIFQKDAMILNQPNTLKKLPGIGEKTAERLALSLLEIDPETIDDVIVGCVDQVDEQASKIARNAVLAAGLPISVAGVTIDRQCGSSLQAVQFAAQGVMAGGYDVVIAAGIESMSRVPIGSSAREGKTPMTESLYDRFKLQGYGFNQFAGAEIIAHEIGLTRERIEAYSALSHKRAYAAQQNGHFDNEKREYVISRVDTPVSWTNYIGTRDMYGVFNHTAGGYLVNGSSEYHRITRFRPPHIRGEVVARNHKIVHI